MEKRIRVGLVGAGYVASRHLAALKDLPFVDLVGICDLDETRAAALARRFGVERTFRSLAAMAEARPDVIHILTPPSSHCPLALEALDMNCHVFLEKPMAETVEECDRIIAKAKEKGLVVSVNHSMLFEPPVKAALDHIARGDCGQLLGMSYFRGSDYPAYSGGPRTAVHRQGSYPFRDLGVHATYLIEGILGRIQTLDVRHYASGSDPMLTFDEWRMSAECEQGTANALLSWNMRPLQNEFWVQGTRGLLHVNVFLQQCHLHRTYPGPKQFHFIINGMRHAAASLVQIPSFLVRAVTGKLKPSPGIYASVIAFHQALHDNQPPPVTAEEGKRAVSWVATASQTADEEKDRIELERTEQVCMPARILVTGASGFLGSALLRRLIDLGEHPRVLLRRPAPTGSLLATCDAVYGSLGEPDAVDRAVQGVDVVYHVGAAMKGGALDFQAGTVWGTRNIVEACLKHGVKRLIYVSSLGVLHCAGHSPGDPITEASPVEPQPDQRGVYTQTKLEAEQIVLDAVRERGLPAVIVRPGQIFGPGAEQVTPNGVIRLAGQWIIAGQGKRLLPLVYVDDVVSGLIAAETAPQAVGHVIHLIDPAPVTQNQYLEWCRPAVGKAPFRRTPVALLMSVGWMCDIMAGVLKRPLPLSRYKIRSLRPLAPADVSTAKKLLGWSPEVGAARGLQLTFGRFRKS